MVKPMNFASKYKGKLEITKNDGTTIDVAVQHLSPVKLVKGKDGILRYDKIVARRAVSSERKTFVEEFQGQSGDVNLKVQFCDRGDEVIREFGVILADIVSSMSGDAEVMEGDHDGIDASSIGIVFESLTLVPRKII